MVSKVLGLLPSGVTVPSWAPVGCISAKVFTVVCIVCFRRHVWAQSSLRWMSSTRAE
jgi:hypothetical protein